jgi:hypothetical protein
VIANGDPVVAQKRMSKHRALEYWRLLVRVARSIRPYGIDHPFDLKAEWRLAKRSIFPMNPSQKVYIPDEPLLS